MNTEKLRTWIEINVNNVKHNFLQIKNHIKNDTKIMCVIKADAYGHGAVFLSRVYKDLGADYFAVSNIDEAIQIRRNNIKLPILILGFTPVSLVKKLFEYEIIQTVVSLEFAKKLSKAALKLKAKIKVHIKIDVGMNRTGLLCENKDIVNDIKKIHNLKGLKTEGIFTHFPCADEKKFHDLTIKQFNNFKNLVKKLEEEKVYFKVKHCSNSAAILNYEQMNMDMVRPGIILYGLMPSSEVKNSINLKPVMSWKVVISQIKIIKKNEYVSYGGAFKTKKKTKIATVPIGYADGYSRLLSNKGMMTIRDKKVPVVGKVCMDQLLLDVSSIFNLNLDDVVTVFENDIDELSKLCLTINYEFCCGVGKRVTRTFVENGKTLEKLNYICK